MSILRHISIKQRIIIGFLVSFALLVLVSVIQFLGFQGINHTMHEVVEQRQPRAFGVKDLNTAIRDASSQLGFFSATGEPSLANGFNDRIEQIRSELDKQSSLYGDNTAARQQLQSTVEKIDRFSELGKRIIALNGDQEGNYPGVAYANAKINPVTIRMTQQAAGLLRSEVSDGERDELQPERLATYSDLRDALSNLMRGLRGYLAFRAESQKLNTLAYLDQAQTLLERIGTWSDKFTFEQEEYFASLQHDIDELRNHVARMLEIHGSEKWRTDSWMLTQDVLPMLATIEQQFDALVTEEEHGIAEISGALLQDAESATRLSTWLVVFGVLAGAAVAVLITRSIAKPICSASMAMSQVAEGEGDLTHRLEESGNDELSQLARGFNGFVKYIQHVISQTAKTTSTVIGGVAGTNESIGRIVERTLTQQQETDQVAAAITELSASVGEVASNATRAEDAAREALDETRIGKSRVDSTASGIRELAQRLSGASELMQRLDADAQSISSVIDVIRSIAEQTNLLALNAAIEAARAGEQGRGFAVVADEVRTLANRTHTSTVEIEGMVARLAASASDAVNLMSEGRTMAESNVEQASETIAALNSIESAVKTISEMNGQIAVAVAEQRAVTQNIHEAAEHVSNAGRANAEEAERTRESATRLADQIANLQSLIGRFKFSSAEFDFEMAKSAHLAWRARVRNYLDGTGSLKADEVVSHRNCSLGKWYYGEGMKKYGNLPAMRAIEQPHERLHALIGEIVSCRDHHDLHGAEQRFTELSSLSERIVNELDHLEESLSTSGAAARTA